MNTLKHPIALTPPVSSETGLPRDAKNTWGWRYDLPIPLGITVAKDILNNSAAQVLHG